MKATFAVALRNVLAHEGGYVNDPQDPGGATNRGVTQAVYDDWRDREGLGRRSVRLINSHEVGAIYRGLYWDACRCDELPAGVDYCVFDFAVNSGPRRAARYLQQAAGVAPDGTIGAATLAAVKAIDPAQLIAAICAARLAFLEQLATFARFGRGWSARVAAVRACATGLAA